jgi:phosphoribosylanthranilate isomerase
VGVEIKFCGLTRPEDAEMAASLGAAYVGAIFAGGPRAVTPDHAKIVLADVPTTVRRVGVFANKSSIDSPNSARRGDDAHEIRRVVDLVGLDVVQLHGEASAERIAELRSAVDVDIWAVVRVSSVLPPGVASLIDVSDGLLLDTFAANTLGGTGLSFAWGSVATELQRIRADKPIILAGGLRPDNVGQAIAALAPDVVDVSSGVESAPGIKAHERMRAFRDAVMHASISL